MRILMVSSFLPYPLFSGGHVRLYNLIKALADKHEITLICEKRNHQTSEDVKAVEKICKKVITVERKRQWSLSNITGSLLSQNSFLVTGHTSEDFKNKIAEALQNETYDLIHVETYYVMQNLPPVTTPIVLAEHNIEYMVYKRYADKVPKIIRPLLQIDINKIRKEEEKSWSRADKLIAVSMHDGDVMRKKGVVPEIVANGVDANKFAFKQKAKNNTHVKKVLFIGDFKWIQNRDAAAYIIKEIWPALRHEAGGSLKLWIVGREIPKSIKSLTDDSNIIFDEKSSEKPTEEIFQEADVLLAPIRVGGGTSYKILESMSCGTPVVTTRMSADAIGAKDGEDIMIGETVQDFAEKTLQIIQEDLYKKIAKNGRALVEKNYTWGKIANDLEGVYKRLV